MLRKFVLCLIVLYSPALMAQDSLILNSPYAAGSSLPAAGKSLSPLQFNFRTGAVFTTGSGGDLFTTYAAPEFSRNLGKKFTLSAGAVFSNTNFSNVPVADREGGFRPYSGNLTGLTIYGAGSVQVNDRLTLSGSAFKTINPAFSKRLSSDALQMDARGMSFGVGYKLSDNVHIGAEVRFQDGNSNSFYPYGYQGGNNFFNGMY